MSQWHTNKPWSSLLKYHSFTVYCAYNTHFNSVRTRIQFSPYAYGYKFVRTCAILSCHVFGTCSYVHMPLYPDVSLPLSPNSVLNVRPLLSTERPLLFIVEIIRKNHDTLRYVTFLYKNRIFRKKLDNLHYFFYVQNLETFRYAIFH